MGAPIHKSSRKKRLLIVPAFIILIVETNVASLKHIVAESAELEKRVFGVSEAVRAGSGAVGVKPAIV